MESYRESFRFFVWFVTIVSFLMIGCASTSKNSGEDSELLAAIPSKAPETDKKIEKMEGEETAPLAAPADPTKKWSLQDCIQYAYEHNEKVQSLMARGMSIDGQIIEAWSAYLPTAKFLYLHANTNETDDVNFYQIAGKSLLWDSGKTKSKVKKLEAEQEMYRSAKFGEILNVTFQVKKAFYDLLYQRYLVAAKKAELESAKINEDTMKTRVTSGRSREADLLAARASVAEAEQGLLESSNAYHLAMQRLNHYMGRDLKAPLEIEGELTFTQIPMDAEHRQKLVARALADNPTLKQLEQIKEQARFSQEEARRHNYPDFYATAFFEYRDTDRELQFVNGNERLFEGRAYGVGVEVELPLFQGIGVAYGKTRAADQMLQSAEEEHKNAIREVAYHIEELCNKMEEATRGIYTAQISVEYQDKVLSMTESGMLEGSSQTIDVIVAKKNLANARVSLMKYILDYNIAKAELDRVLGILEYSE